MKFEWENIEVKGIGNSIRRSKVIGGWLVQTIIQYYIPTVGKNNSHYPIYGDPIFISDPNHEWEIDK